MEPAVMPWRRRAAPHPLIPYPQQAPGSQQRDAVRREVLRKLMAKAPLAKAPNL